MQEFLVKTSVHGVKFVADEERSRFERLLWVSLVLASVFAMTHVIVDSYDCYKSQAMAFSSNTAYLHWNTDFPSISVCEKGSEDKIDKLAERMYGKDRDLNIDMFLMDIGFFEGNCHSCSSHCITGRLNCSADLPELARKLRFSCEELLSSCTWNGKDFDCCRNFLPLPTELGLCYSLNSAMVPQQEASPINNRSFKGGKEFLSQREVGAGTLTFKAKESVMVYLHSKYDVPYSNHPLQERVKVDLGMIINAEFKMTTVHNEEGVEDLAVWQRKCRFPWENPNIASSPYKLYSYSSCVVSCHASAQMEICNCTDHFISSLRGWTKSCTVEGLVCLSKHHRILRSLKTAWSNKHGLNCDCDTGCLEDEYSIILMRNFEGSHQLKESTISMKMNALPFSRFERSVIRKKLDLLVSIGGTTSLFLGASVLSGAEFLYYFLKGGFIVFRKMFTKSTCRKSLT